MSGSRIIACSYSGGLAADFSRKNLDIIRSDKYQKCFPNIKLGLEQAVHFTNSEHGERYCAGIGGAITGKHAHCFPAGTEVSVLDGVKPIEQLKVGDYVASDNGRLVYKKVVATLNRETDELYEVEAGACNVASTSEHHFFVYGQGYKKAKDLQIGDVLILFKEGQLLYPRIESIKRISNIAEIVYDIEVEDTHNYYANGFLVHNCIIIDDPMNPMEAASEAGLRTANMWLHETIPTRMVNPTITPIIMIMQRLHQDDPTGDWLVNAKEGSFKFICLPADCSEGQKVLPAEVKANYVDGLLDPLRLPRELLEQRRKWMGEYGYACQYDQQPIPRSGGMFLVERLSVCPVDIASDPIIFCVRYWDKAVSTKKTACYTVGVKLGKSRAGKYYVLDVIRGRWNSDARERLIKQTAIADGKKVIVAIEQEPGPIWEEETVQMADGSVKLLRDVVVGDYVINQYGKATVVEAVHEQGLLPCLEVKTDSGRILHLAPNHPVLTTKGFINAGDLVVGDFVGLRSNFQIKTFLQIDFARDFFPDPVVSIREVDELPCRCLTVADGESFVVNDIVVHNSGGMESALNTVRNLDGFVCKIDKADIHKETRAEPFSSQVNGYNVFLIQAPWNTEYISELQYFPSSKYKDQVDASAGAFNLIATMTRRVATGW
jgi:phage terminase large subunit-like protein